MTTIIERPTGSSDGGGTVVIAVIVGAIAAAVIGMVAFGGFQRQPDTTVTIDTPAAGETADAQTVAVRAGAALIVARKNAARKWHVQGISESVAEAKVNIVGAVLNSF